MQKLTHLLPAMSGHILEDYARSQCGGLSLISSITVTWCLLAHMQQIERFCSGRWTARGVLYIARCKPQFAGMKS